MRNYFLGIKEKKNGPAISIKAINSMQAKLVEKIVVVERTDQGPTAQRSCKPKYTMMNRFGLAAIYNFGDHKSSMSWVYKPQRAETDADICIRPGILGRFIFGPRSEFPARAFEWVVVEDRTGTAQYIGKPKFKLWELAPRPPCGLQRSQTSVIATSPNALWDLAYVKFLGRERCSYGARMCGLQSPNSPEANVSLARLMALDGRDPMHLYGIRKAFANFSHRWLRHW